MNGIVRVSGSKARAGLAVFTAALLMALFSLCGCSSAALSPVVGSWHAEGFYLNDEVYDISLLDSSGPTARFEADNTYRIVLGDGQIEGTLSRRTADDGTVLYMLEQGLGGMAVHEDDINAATLLLNAPDYDGESSAGSNTVTFLMRRDGTSGGIDSSSYSSSSGSSSKFYSSSSSKSYSSSSGRSSYSSGSSSYATSGERNALETALRYLDLTAFSREGLIEQLEYEGYSTSEAEYAVDNCGADWYKQAELSAARYLDLTSFSRKELVEQLEYEGFTHDQAEHGADVAY